jgi:NTE family protein
MGNQTKTIAVVLAGAVARGAFEAGAIRALANADVQIVRIIGASAGALNGTLLASAVRGRSLRAGAEALHALWRDHATWKEVFHVSLRDLLAGEGVSDQARLLALMRQHVPPSRPADPADINLRIVVAALQGRAGSIGSRPATTFEAIRDFDTTAFASADALERVFVAAAASAGLPIVFAPVDLADIGPCIDGGTVNNTPMKWALDDSLGAQIDAVVVVSTSVELRTASPVERSGIGLIGHFAEMLVDERLYRDLREASQVNATLARIDELVQQGVLDAAQRGRVMEAFGWADRRQVEVVQIRPVVALRGTAFDGLFDADLRNEQLEAGFVRGQEILRGLGWSS